MISTWIESVLPGARSLRPPLVAGLLWGMFLWIVLTEHIPNQQQAEGWPAQAYALAAAAGPFASAIIVSVLLWVIGVMSMAATIPLAAMIGSVLLRAKRALAWQSHARKNVSQLKHRLVEAEASRKSLEEQADESKAKLLERTDKQIEDLSSKLAHVANGTRLKVLIGRTSNTTAALGDLPADSASDIAEYLVEGAAKAAVDDAIAKNDKLQPKGSVSFNNLWDIQDAFLQEFDPDPMDTLRSLDEKLYLELDRERSEREVRLAVAPPLVALGITGSLNVTLWFAVVVLLGTVLFLQSSAAQSFERSRIMKLVGLKGLQTPALRAAAAAGREGLRRNIATPAPPERARSPIGTKAASERIPNTTADEPGT